jgi:hypothetical protein
MKIEKNVMLNWSMEMYTCKIKRSTRRRHRYLCCWCNLYSIIAQLEDKVALKGHITGSSSIDNDAICGIFQKMLLQRFRFRSTLSDDNVILNQLEIKTFSCQRVMNSITQTLHFHQNLHLPYPSVYLPCPIDFLLYQLPYPALIHF